MAVINQHLTNPDWNEKYVNTIFNSPQNALISWDFPFQAIPGLLTLTQTNQYTASAHRACIMCPRVCVPAEDLRHTECCPSARSHSLLSWLRHSWCHHRHRRRVTEHPLSPGVNNLTTWHHFRKIWKSGIFPGISSRQCLQFASNESLCTVSQSEHF